MAVLLSVSQAFLYQGLVPLAPEQMKVTFEPSEVRQIKELESTSIIIWASKSYSDVAVFAKAEAPDVASVSEE
jgi:hypothetical protein